MLGCAVVRAVLIQWLRAVQSAIQHPEAITDCTGNVDGVMGLVRENLMGL
jgi:hypothetical protein